MKTKLAITAAVISAAHWAFTPKLEAAATVYEGFSYTPGQNISTQTSTATGIGNWSTYNGILGTTDATGLTFGSLVTTGGSLDVTAPTANNNWDFLTAPITNTIANGQTLYVSYLFKYTGPGGGNAASDNFGVGVGGNGDGHTMSLLAHQYQRNPNNMMIAYGDQQGTEKPSGNIFDGSTYLFVGEWTNLGGSSSATGWLLNVSNFNAISGSTITDSSLNANNMATASATGTAGTFDLTQFVKIGDFIGENVNYNLDEIRYSTSLSDVLPVVAVPEPSTYTLFGLGIGALFFLRRKQTA